MLRAAHVPPQSLEAEQATLGAMLLEGSAIEKACEVLRSDDFYREAHKLIFRAAADLSDRNEPVDLTTLGNELETRGQLEQAGGRPYLAALLDQIPTAAHVQFYARIVEQKAVLRRLIGVATDAVEECFGDVDDAGAVVARVAAAIDAIERRRETVGVIGLAGMAEQALSRYERLKEQPRGTSGVPSGLRALDDVTQGWQRGDLHVIGGRPGMGKTALWMTCALSAAQQGRKVLAFSLEMNAEQLENRIYQGVAGVESWRLRTGRLEDRHWADLAEATNTLMRAVEGGGEVWIDYTRGITPRYVMSKARRALRETGLDMVVVDYIQRMACDGPHENETHKVSSIVDGLLSVADNLNLPVVAVTQLSRDVERRDDKRPNMADVRQSGRIEENAAFVGLLFRPSYYRPKGEAVPDKDPCKLIVGKARHGGPAWVPLTFLPAQAKFIDAEERDDGDE